MSLLENMLRLLPAIGPVAAALPEFVAVFNAAAELLDGPDQATAKDALAAIQADNDAGHARLQQLLEDLARRGG